MSTAGEHLGYQFLLALYLLGPVLALHGWCTARYSLYCLSLPVTIAFSTVSTNDMLSVAVARYYLSVFLLSVNVNPVDPRTLECSSILIPTSKL